MNSSFLMESKKYVHPLPSLPAFLTFLGILAGSILVGVLVGGGAALAFKSGFFYPEPLPMDEAEDPLYARKGAFLGKPWDGGVGWPNLRFLLLLLPCSPALVSNCTLAALQTPLVKTRQWTSTERA